MDTVEFLNYSRSKYFIRYVRLELINLTFWGKRDTVELLYYSKSKYFIWYVINTKQKLSTSNLQTNNILWNIIPNSDLFWYNFLSSQPEWLDVNKFYSFPQTHWLHINKFFPSQNHSGPIQIIFFPSQNHMWLHINKSLFSPQSQSLHINKSITSLQSFTNSVQKQKSLNMIEVYHFTVIPPFC